MEKKAPTKQDLWKGFIKIGNRIVRDEDVKGFNIIVNGEGRFCFSIILAGGVIADISSYATEEEVCRAIQAIIKDIR